MRISTEESESKVKF